MHAPAWQLAARIRKGELSPVAVVDAYIARIEAVNPRLNALVAERFDDARREARAAEAQARVSVDRDALPPLLGVPCTVKEFLGVKGLPQTAGILRRKGVRAERDATVVKRLREAGAIVLGVSNVPEGKMWMETYNPIYGRTSNPWDTTRTSGGSSGGEAALVAAAASPFGIGSDIAGSIRIPAAMCGVIGHKPSDLLGPNTGHWPGGAGDAERMLSTGVLGRCVRDVELVLERIAWPDGESAAIRTLPPVEPALAAGDLRGVRVVPIVSNGRVRVAPVMRQAVERATAALAARGAEVVELDDATWRRLFGKSLATWLAGLSAAGDQASFAQLIGGDDRIALIPEVWRILRGKPRFAAATLGLVAIERFTSIKFLAFEQRALSAALPVAELQAGLDEVLGPRGVILHPPYSRPAPKHTHPLLTPFDAVLTALFSVAGMPGTAVPVGFDAHHLPVGVRSAPRRPAFGGWVPASI